MADKVVIWDHGEAEVQLLGGMLGPVRFRLEDGRVVQPLAVAPWCNDACAEHDALPGLTKRLRGEWPCVPFGAPQSPKGLPEEWRTDSLNPVGSEYHGFSSNHPWRVASEEVGAITIASDYPEDHPVRKLTRSIAGSPDKPSLTISLTIEARRAVEVPIALHPVFRLPATPGSALLELGTYDFGRVYPLPVEPGRNLLVPDAAFISIRQIPARPGHVGLDRLPLEFDIEEVVQICGVSGRATLTNAEEGYRAHLGFDPEIFPSLILWISNRGRMSYPWNGRFVALGIEPARSAFDLGPEISSNSGNPIARAGYPTTLALHPGTEFTTSYTIGVESAEDFR